jgi:hypothetical protein
VLCASTLCLKAVKGGQLKAAGAAQRSTLLDATARCEVSADDCLADLETNLDSDVPGKPSKAQLLVCDMLT